MAAKKRSINDYKDRMSAPMGIVWTNPKTGKPKRTRKAAAKKK